MGGFASAGAYHLNHGLARFRHLLVSPLAVMVFQMMFAVITAALITGGIAERVRFVGFAFPRP